MDLWKYYHSRDEVFIFGKMERMASLIDELIGGVEKMRIENITLKARIIELEEKDGADNQR